MKPTITTMLVALATVLFTTTACAGEPIPTPMPLPPATNADTGELRRLARQMQQLQDENAAIREELATLTSASQQQQQTPVTETPVTEIFTPTPDEQDVKPSRPTENICSRSPAAQKLLLEKLSFRMCSIATGEELFRIEELNYRGTLWVGDLNDLVNLKKLELTYLELPLPENILADMVNLETLYLNTDLGNSGLKNRGDEPWILDGTFTGTPNLKALKIDGPNVSLTNETLNGLNKLEGINIKDITSLDADTFVGLESLKKVELNAKSISGQSEERKPTFPANMVMDNPGVESWDISNFALPKVIPFASLEQFCRVGQIAGGSQDTKYQFNGEKMVRVSKDNGVCRIGTGEKNSNGAYPESQIKIVDGRTQATP